MIPALAGCWTQRPDAAADRRLSTLASRTGEVPTAWGPFRVTGVAAGARSSGGCLALIAGRICDLVDGAGADPRAWLAAAYERAGLESLHSLRGEFIAILWDPRRREGVLARDQLGGRCLHYCPIPGGLAFAEDLRDLLPLLAATPGPDRRTVVSLAARGVIPIGRSVFEGVHRLQPGRLLRFADDRWSVESWWRPRYRGVYGGSPAELAERVVAGMDRAVRRCTGGEAVAVMLSGGLDSSTVAASAAQQAVDGSARPVCYSGVFPDRRAADEALLIDETVAYLGIRSVRRVVNGGSAVTGALDYLRHWGVPTASPNHFLWRSLLARARTDGLGVLLDGEGGDEVFDVTTSLIADRIRHGRMLSAVALTRRITGVGLQARPRYVARMFLRHGVRRAAPRVVQRLVHGSGDPAREMPAWLAAEDVPGLLADVDKLTLTSDEGPLWWRDHAYELTGIRELFDAHGYLRRRATEVGLDPRHPFMHDVDLIEMVLALPPEPRFDPDHDRILLRRGLEGRIPDAVRLRTAKSHFTSLLEDALAGGDGALLRELLGDHAAEVRTYVRPDKLDDLLRAAPGSSLAARLASLGALWRLGNLELWLRSLADPGWLEACAQRMPVPAPDEFEVVP